MTQGDPYALRVATPRGLCNHFFLCQRIEQFLSAKRACLDPGASTMVRLG
jgi:hypothetical protein